AGSFEPILQKPGAEGAALVSPLMIHVGISDDDKLGLKRVRSDRRGHVLSDAEGRRPRAADFAVAPRLGSDPLESIFAVARLGPTLIMEDDGMMALGLKSAAQVLSHEGISLAVELGG